MKLLVCIIIVVLCCSTAYAYLPAPTSPYTVTFDDIPPGDNLSYYDRQYGLSLFPGWEVAEQSETNVLAWQGNPSLAESFDFGSDPVDYPHTNFLPYTVCGVGAYFSTEPGVVIRMVGVGPGPEWEEITSVTIGAPEESWNDRYVEIFSAAKDIRRVAFVCVSSTDATYHFYLDDLTVFPVPEPASLVALCAGLIPLAFRRRKR